MSGNQVGRRMPDGGKSKNNMSTPPVGGHNDLVLSKNLKVAITQLCNEPEVWNFTML